MECQDCEEFLSDYVEGELRGDARHYIEEHLSACHNCHEKLHGISQLRNILRSLRHIRPPARLDFALQRLIRLELCNEYGLLRRIRKGRLPLVLAVAAMITIVFVTYKAFQRDHHLFIQPSQGQEITSSLQDGEVTNYVLKWIAPSDLSIYSHHGSATSVADSLSIEPTRYLSTQIRYVIF